MIWGERLREQGREEGREEGREAGALTAKREMLLDVLRIRFGEIPEALTATIALADDAELTRLHHQAITASGLENLAG